MFGREGPKGRVGGSVEHRSHDLSVCRIFDSLTLLPSW
jgi:hypothetical protein